MLTIRALEAFRADPAHAGFFHDGPLVPTPAGWFDAGRLYQLRGLHHQMATAEYVSDLAQFGEADRWDVAADAALTPAEAKALTVTGALTRWRGDCESLCLRAMVEARRLGWPKSAMGIWVRPRQRGWMPGNVNPWLEAHAVLGVDITVGSGGAAYVNEAALDLLARTPTRRADLWGTGWERVA